MNVKKIDTLCLVDDDDIFQFLTSEIIRTTDLVNQIKIFSNGSEAIDFLKMVKDDPAKLPDIIFLDLFMPIMDGWGFLNEFILLRPNLKKNHYLHRILFYRSCRSPKGKIVFGCH